MNDDFAESQWHSPRRFFTSHDPIEQEPVHEAFIDRPWVNRAFAVALGLSMFFAMASGLGAV